MHHTTQVQNVAEKGLEGSPLGFSQGGLETPEMILYTRHEHGNCPVRVHRGEDGNTLYELTVSSDGCSSGRSTMTFTSARALISSLYGHDVHMPFDRYFRIGKYRQRGRASGGANILTLFDARAPRTRQTPIAIHSRGLSTRKTNIVFSKVPADLPSKPEAEVSEVKGEGLDTPDPVLESFVAAFKEDLRPQEEFIEATDEMVEAFERSFALELDRLSGVVGIELDAKSTRSGSRTKADEVRRLLWRGFAGRMLSQGYDPDDVLQEVYRGLLVRNNGKCPWDVRKSTFGHYVHMVISCVLTNYHRKQVRRIDRDPVPLTVTADDGEELELPWGSVEIHEGSEVGDMLVLEQLAKHLAQVASQDPEAVLGRRILPLVASGHQRAEIVRKTGANSSLVSRALAWLRQQTAKWAARGGLEGYLPSKYQFA